jgi:hypothetical protein
MNDTQATRRRFLVAALTFSGVASSSLGLSLLHYSIAWAESADNADGLAAMGRLAQLLFPHPGLDDSVYGSVIGEVLAITAADPATAGLLGIAEEALNAQQDQAWADVPEAEQLAALTKVQNEAFIIGIRELVRFRLYDNPGLWKHLNYPGSSKEFGGYINRGFNDIDWLPEEN